MKDKLRQWYDAAHNKTEINDAYLQGMWDEAMLAVRTMGQEISTLETEQIMLGSRIAELEAENAKLKDTALYGLFKKWMITAMELKEENRKLREALRFYANKSAYLFCLDSVVWNDGGIIARKALGGEG